MKQRASVAFAIVAGIATSWGVVHAGGFQITAHGISPGGGRSASAGGCRQLEATFGEPANGRSAGGGYVLAAGFRERVATYRSDSIFNDGFQECL